MNGSHKRTRMSKSLISGLILIMLLSGLSQAGMAGGREATQPAPSEVLDLDSEPTLADLGLGAAVQQGAGIDRLLPYNRIGHTTIFDPWNDRIILFGGFNGRTYFSDVWALDISTQNSEAWTKLDAGDIAPQPRAFHSAIFDSPNRRMIIFGGRSPYQNWNDVWALDLTTPGSEAWTLLTPAGSPPAARRWHTAIRDQDHHRMIVFGGAGRGGLFNDVWALDLTAGSEAWSQLAVVGSVPTARGQHTAIYDSANQQMVVFGGGALGGALLNDTWVLSLTATTPVTWTHLALGSKPSARRGHVIGYEDGQQRLHVFGGLGSSGFLSDTWRLNLTPGSEQWIQSTVYGEKPTARAWHAAAVKSTNSLMYTLGGRGTEPLNGAQWYFSIGTATWHPITPTLPGWSQQMGTFQAAATSATNEPQVSLQIEDAQPETVVNLLRGSEVWFVAKIKSTSATYVNGITVTLNVDAAKLRIDQIGTRHNDWDNPSWGTLIDLGSGRYRIQNASLTKLSGDAEYKTQVVFRGYSLTTNPVEGYTSPSVEAKGTNWPARLSDSATARIYRDPQAWLITNRTLLFDKYNNTEAQNLLDEVFEQAQGSGYNSNPTMAVLYADRYVASLKTWNNRTVNYHDPEGTINTVSIAVDQWLDTYWGVHPEYLVILGDDNILPFYRKHDYPVGCSDGPCSEHDHPDCWGNEQVCDDLVSHDYFMTDNIYGDIPSGLYSPTSDWEYGNLEIAVGRIVGFSAADMQYFLENSVRGPNSNTSRAIVASDGLDWWLTGDGNDAHDVIKDSLGYSLVEGYIDQNPTKTDVVNEMKNGFAVMAAAHHGEVYVWQAPGGGGASWPNGDLLSNELPLYDPSNKISTNRPFFYFNACRMGYSYTSGWGAPDYYDDSMIYALVHRGASGIIASAGIGYGCFGVNDPCNSEILGNDFWEEAKATSSQSDPLAWALMRAKVGYPYAGDTDKKTVQTFTYFGVPWMRLPGHGGTMANTLDAPQPNATTAAWSMPVRVQSKGGYAPAAVQATYVVTAHVTVSSYATSTLAGGFHLIEVPGFTQRMQNGQPVVPYTMMDLILPLSATISGVAFTPTQPVTLTGLNIPTLLAGVPIPGGPTSGYTTTITGTAATVTMSVLNMGTYRIARFYVMPVGYNANEDWARLYQSIDLQVEYDTPRTVALTYFSANKLRYLPGDSITVTASISNAGSVAETVTPTLRIIDSQGQFTTTVGAAFVVPAGGSYDLNMSWTGYLDGDVYMAQLLLEQGGEVIAGAGRQIFVTEGGIADLAAPGALIPGQTGVFTVTFQNYTTYTTTASASLTIYDSDDAVLVFLEPKSVSIAGAISATLTFTWTADRLGPFTASTVVMAGGEEYGPVSENVSGGFRVFLPVVLRNAGP